MAMNCRLCNGTVEYMFRLRVLSKYDVNYYKCLQCDLIQTESPYWLKEAYARVIASLDTGAIARSTLCARVALTVAHVLRLKQSSRCLDYGAGHGVYVRMMRDAGVNCYWHDKYAGNIFAVGFEGDPAVRYDVVTAFDVFEHFDHVGEEVNALFKPRHDYILVGTELHTGNAPDWWYYLPQTGQHISFFSKTTMAFIGKLRGYRMLTRGAFTLFINEDLPRNRVRESILLKAMGNSPLVSFLALAGHPFESLTWKDHLSLAKIAQ